jgi:hypothetical protein
MRQAPEAGLDAVKVRLAADNPAALAPLIRITLPLAPSNSSVTPPV